MERESKSHSGVGVGVMEDGHRWRVKGGQKMGKRGAREPGRSGFNNSDLKMSREKGKLEEKEGAQGR